MTAGKNQAQAIVFEEIVFNRTFGRSRLCFDKSRELVLRRIESCAPAQRVDGFEAGRRDQPWTRVAGHSSRRPQAERGRKGFMHRLLGKIKIPEQADQRSE